MVGENRHGLLVHFCAPHGEDLPAPLEIDGLAGPVRDDATRVLDDRHGRALFHRKVERQALRCAIAIRHARIGHLVQNRATDPRFGSLTGHRTTPKALANGHFEARYFCIGQASPSNATAWTLGRPSTRAMSAVRRSPATAAASSARARSKGRINALFPKSGEYPQVIKQPSSRQPELRSGLDRNRACRVGRNPALQRDFSTLPSVGPTATLPRRSVPRVMSTIGFVSDAVRHTANVTSGSVIAAQWGLAAARLDVAVHEAGIGQVRTLGSLSASLSGSGKADTRRLA